MGAIGDSDGGVDPAILSWVRTLCRTEGVSPVSPSVSDSVPRFDIETVSVGIGVVGQS